MPSLTYQYRIYPFGEQAETLERWIGLCRKLYNSGLEQRKIARNMGSRIGYPEQQAELTDLRASMPEYEDVPSHVLQNVLLRLDRAMENFFRRCRRRKSGKKVKPGFPRFKARDRYRSLTCPDRYDYIREGDLHFPKIGRIKMVMHRPLPEDAIIKTCTISKKTDGWYASFSLGFPASPKPIHHGEHVGIDMGLESFATRSTGEKVQCPKYLLAMERRLKRAQRVFSRRKKGSKRRAKQRERVARLHLRVARQRGDFQWKLATELAHRYSLIAVERLTIRGMVQNHHLATSISDASWSAFVHRLEHAVVKTGSRLIKVDARGTSSRCSECEWVKGSMPLSERVFRCEKCPLVLDRDVNAARNILKLGRDAPEVTLGEIRPSAFRYRKVRSVAEPRTVPGAADVA